MAQNNNSESWTSDFEKNKLDSRQIKIYQGLTNIGEEIASLYIDGIKIFNSNQLASTSYLLGHIVREIECGLRDILVVHEIVHESKCEKCNQIIKSDENKHIKEICIAIDVKEDHPLAIEWYKVAKTFNKYAHRHGAWKEPRDALEIKKIWKEFEVILFKLIGTYYNLLSLLDRILKYDTPTEEILGTLSNLLKVEARHSYFFKNLNYSSWLKPLQKQGYFNPENNPKPHEVVNQPGFYTIPHWSVLDYLENVANKNVEDPPTETTDTLIEIINSIVTHRDKIDNYRTDWFMIKIIATFPIEKIEDQHIEFVRTALNTSWGTAVVESEIGKTLLPHMIKNKAKILILKLLEVIFDFQVGKEENKEKYKPLMDKHWLSTSLKKNKSEIIKICGVEPALIALDKMKAIIKISDSHFHIPWIPAIEDHPQNRHTDKYEYQLVLFVRDTLEKSPPAKISETIKDLIKEEHHIFKRIAIHTINHHYDNLNDIFWSWEGNPLEEYGLKHEIYELLKGHCTTFNEVQIDKIIEWIESKDYYIHEEIKDDREKKNIVIAYRKREWLSALLGADNSKIKERYRKYEEINPVKIEHAGFDHWSETRWGSISPITQEELSEKSNSEIAEYLNNYREKGIGWKTPTKEGLSDIFRKCVSSNPEKFAGDLNPFYKVQRTYQHDLLWGLWEAWRNKKSFEWDELFKFISEIISSEEFWSNENGSDQRDYRDSIISQVAELIHEGTRDDSHAFKPELLPAAEKNLLIIVEKTESRLHEMGDLITSVLNSTKGNIFSAMVNYSLRYTRLNKKDEDERWVETIKHDFDRRLDRQYKPSVEFSVILGEYLPNLYYLSKDWVIDNINRIFPKNDETHWKASFSGYLFYASTVYEELYTLLRTNGHYEIAIGANLKDDQISDRLVQHICLGYLNEWERLEDKNSLLSKLIDMKNSEQLSDIVSFFLMLPDRPIDKTKIKPLWKVLFEIASHNIDNSEYQIIISDISKWVSLIEGIDDELFEWLKLSAKYVGINHNTSLFVEYLIHHVERDPEKVGNLYLEMLNSDIYPDYQDEEINNIVETLYKKGQKEIADRICNRYGEKGYHFDFLRKLYEQFK